MERLKYLCTLLFATLFILNKAFSQENKQAVIFHITSAHTPFPDTARLKGHLGDGVFYSTAAHYRDSTVLVITPPNLDANKRVDLIFWFHGWHNNIDNAAQYYHLTSQFIASGLNAVLVLPEAAKDAADSYGGRLENRGVFKSLVNDVIRALKERHQIPENCKPGNILLGGHSGGGEVMAFIVEKGGIKVNEAILFDALYDGTEKFISWLNNDHDTRFVHLFTDYGEGPKEESQRMVKLLKDQNTPLLETEEPALTPAIIRNTRLLFIHSMKPHNDIIFNPDNFKLLFENSPFLKKINTKQ